MKNTNWNATTLLSTNELIANFYVCILTNTKQNPTLPAACETVHTFACSKIRHKITVNSVGLFSQILAHGNSISTDKRQSIQMCHHHTWSHNKSNQYTRSHNKSNSSKLSYLIVASFHQVLFDCNWMFDVDT